MIRKIGFFGLVAFLFLPVASFAQSPADSMDPAERLDISDIPTNSIVVLSKEESDVPGYVHQKYAFVSQACPGRVQIVDRHGAPIDPKDADLLLFESQQCTFLQYRDTGDE